MFHTPSELTAVKTSGDLVRRAHVERTADDVWFHYRVDAHSLVVTLYFVKLEMSKLAQFKLAALAIQARSKGRVVWSKEAPLHVGRTQLPAYQGFFTVAGADGTTMHSYLAVTGTKMWTIKVRATYDPTLPGADEYVMAQVEQLLRTIR